GPPGIGEKGVKPGRFCPTLQSGSPCSRNDVQSRQDEQRGSDVQAEQFIIDVTEHNLTEVLEASRQMPVIVDFWADWCQPCQQMAPVLEKIVREQAGRVLLAKVNADQQQVIAGQFGVRSLPTLNLVYQG